MATYSDDPILAHQLYGFLRIAPKEPRTGGAEQLFAIRPAANEIAVVIVDHHLALTFSKPRSDRTGRFFKYLQDPA